MATILALLALVPLLVGLMVTGDGTQMIYKPPSRLMAYHVYRNRYSFIAASIVLWVLANIIHVAIAPTSASVLIITGIAGIVLTVMAFFMSPYILFPRIKNPVWLTVEEADQRLSPETQVLGIELHGDARAYPVGWIMRPHIVEDTIGTERLTMTFCVLSNLGQAYRTGLDGAQANLITALQWENNLVLYDTRNERMYQQIQGEITDKPEQDRLLVKLPTRMMSWSAWRKLYPQSKVCYNPPVGPVDQLVRFLLLNKAVASLKHGKPFFPTIKHFDPRLPKTTQVIGVRSGDLARAYTLDLLYSKCLVNDTLGSTNLLLVANYGQGAIDVFNRALRGKTLEFDYVPIGEEFTFRDTETNSLWDMRGHSIGGPMKGDHLELVSHASKVFWYSWSNFYPQTELMTLESDQFTL